MTSKTSQKEKLHLSQLSIKQLVEIAKKYGLREYKRKRKNVLIYYILNNLDNSTIEKELKSRLEHIEIINIPVMIP